MEFKLPHGFWTGNELIQQVAIFPSYEVRAKLLLRSQMVSAASGVLIQYQPEALARQNRGILRSRFGLVSVSASHHDEISKPPAEGGFVF